MVGAGLAHSAWALEDAPPQALLQAHFGHERPSEAARHVADWVVGSRDNQRLPFVVVDKVAATVFVFDADGRLQGAAPALLGLARGDDAVPGIGNRPLSAILPYERTTPAGRFVANLDKNLKGSDILWVDYDGAVSLHAVVTQVASERRAQRLSSPTPTDNRISFGCINVSAGFFQTVVLPAFRQSNGVVYVLPESRSVQQVFGVPPVVAGWPAPTSDVQAAVAGRAR